MGLSVASAVGLVLAFMVTAIVVPIGMTQLVNANTTAWGATATIFSILLPILMIIGIAIRFLTHAKDGGG